jgi:ABC-2 type transport system ATP-binding protein
MNKVEQLCDRALMINHGHMVLYGPVREIRRRYSDHAVVLSTTSRLGPVPGVKSSVTGGNGDVTLLLESTATPQAVLRELLDRGVDVESFALASLPLEDIFVKVVREGLGLDQGQSGSPEPELALAGGGKR